MLRVPRVPGVNDTHVFTILMKANFTQHDLKVTELADWAVIGGRSALGIRYM